jgi:hypothetical protein
MNAEILTATFAAGLGTGAILWWAITHPDWHLKPKPKPGTPLTIAGLASLAVRPRKHDGP